MATAAPARIVSAEQELILALTGEGGTGPQLADAVDRGLSTASIEVLRKEGLTFTEVHELVLPARTLKHRRLNKQRLSSEESDRAIRVARTLGFAERVFGNRDKAFHWLRQPNRSLRLRPPLGLLRTQVGAELVRGMLIQIDEGMVV